MFHRRSDVVHLIAPSETARTGVFGISMKVWPGPTFVGVQPTCVMSNVPDFTCTIARPGWMCQPES